MSRVALLLGKGLALAEKAAGAVELDQPVAAGAQADPGRSGLGTALPAPRLGQVLATPEQAAGTVAADAGDLRVVALRLAHQAQQLGAGAGLALHPLAQPLPLADQAFVGDVDDRVAGQRQLG